MSGNDDVDVPVALSITETEHMLPPNYDDTPTYDVSYAYVAIRGTHHDNTGESDSTVTIKILPQPQTYTISGSASLEYTVEDIDTSAGDGPSVSISRSTTTPAVVTEGTRVWYTISVNPVPTSYLSVKVRISDNQNTGTHAGTWDEATNGFATYPGEWIVGFNPNQGSVRYGVYTTNDSTDEPDGSVTVTVLPRSSYTVSNAASSARVTVRDND